MRRRYDIWKPRQLRCRHLIPGAAYVDRRAGNAVLAQRSGQCSLIDQIAPGQIDKKRVRPHARQGCLPDQILGLFVRHRETNDVIGPCEKILKRDMLDISVIDSDEGIGDQNRHAQRFRDRRQIAADAAVADDAETAAG